MKRSEKPHQFRLFPFDNPLRSVEWDKTFGEMTSEPGIYHFYNHEGELLYVGKAKNLKKRLQSYRYVHPDRNSSKTVRLVTHISVIEVTRTDTEADALKLENRWLRESKPPYNRANTQHEKYLFIGLEPSVSDLHFRWTMNADTLSTSYRFGAFPAIGPAFQFMMALRRISWLFQHKSTYAQQLPFYFQRRKPPQQFSLSLDREPEIFSQLLFLLMTGRSDEWVDWCEYVLSMLQPSNFCARYIITNLEECRYFYNRYLRKQMLMKKALKLDDSVFNQDRIDDATVDYAFLS